MKLLPVLNNATQIVIGLFAVLLLIWALWDIATRRLMRPILKIAWLAAIVFIPFFGAVFYLIEGRGTRLEIK
jgi:uncharacterized membrane protein YhaH (DUF805 family)